MSSYPPFQQGLVIFIEIDKFLTVDDSNDKDLFDMKQDWYKANFVTPVLCGKSLSACTIAKISNIVDHDLNHSTMSAHIYRENYEEHRQKSKRKL